MKLFETKQISKIDELTLQYEPIANIDLMERAAKTVYDFIINHYPDFKTILLFCGQGNNGGDGLALARMLANYCPGAAIEVFILELTNKFTLSAQLNYNRLCENTSIKPIIIRNASDFPMIPSFSLVVDALFGSGLNRPLIGLPRSLVQYINQHAKQVLSIDIPSGLMGEDNALNDYNSIIVANKTITFQFPKIAFLLAENEKYVGDYSVVDIGLHQQAIIETKSNYFLQTDFDVTQLLKKRSRFSHKGTFGHALLIAGSYGKMGAAVLASKSCLRSGVGLLTVHVPNTGYQIIQNALPEAMTSIDESDLMFTSINQLDAYSAIGIGPGLGVKVNTIKAVKLLIEQVKTPMVIDADALNILAQNPEWIKLLPVNTVITPHPKEFDRLAGISTTAYERLTKAIQFAEKHNLIVVLKGANTQIVNSDGTVWFNSTGNPGMATAGSGGALTGIILALLAAGYQSLDAARLGVYVHGLSGDIAAARRGYEALIASDIIENIGEGFKLLHK